MELITVKTIATAATIAGTAMSAITAIQQGQMAQQAAEQNAALLEQEAEAKRFAGEVAGREKRKEGREAVERGRAHGGGIVPGTGTLGLLAEETAAEFERDARYIQAGYGMEAEQSLSRARLEKYRGGAARRASLWRMGSTIATGAYNVADIYATPKTEPLFKTQLRQSLLRRRA